MKTKLSAIMPALALLAALPCGASSAAFRASAAGASTDSGLYLAYCPQPHHASAPHPVPAPLAPETQAPASQGAQGEAPPSGGETRPPAVAASTSEAGWPAKECLKMDKGPAGRRHTIVGVAHLHNWLLGGYGDDTIIGGERGDVIWADYHPSGQPRFQTAIIHAGDGRNVIYANDTRNYVWTGTNPRTVVHAHVSGISGVIHCQSAGVVLYLSTVSERHFQLDGCRHISHFSVGH